MNNIQKRLREVFIQSKKAEREGNVHVFLQNIKITKKLVRANLFSTALGMYEIEINGEKAGNTMLAPGYTYYPHRVLYQTTDVTRLLNEGKNSLTAYLAQGWYCGWFTCHKKYKIYGDAPKIAWVLELEYEDGTRQEKVSDDSAREEVSPYSYAGLYNGEEYFADKEIHDTSVLMAEDAEKYTCHNYEGGIPAEIVPAECNVRVQEHMPIREVYKYKDKTILDFGQNFAGIVEIHPEKLTDETVVIRHGEILNEDGSLYTENLRSAKAEIIYHAGNSKKVYRPRFTYMGFRYIEITGTAYYDGLVESYAVYSDMKRTGYFNCDHVLVQKLYENQVWGQKSNYVGIPTDCPQRDEREGYTGDAHVFARTGSYNFDTCLFWKQFMRDMELGQKDNTEGYIGGTVPATEPGGIGKISMLGWGNAVTLIPEMLYQQYGEEGTLIRQYESMKLFVEAEIRKMGRRNLWLGISLGDWLTYGKSVSYLMMHNNPVSNAFVIHDLDVIAETAGMMEKQEEQERYRQQAERSRRAYIRKYIRPNGKAAADDQAAYIMALQFVLKDGPLKKKVFRKFIKNVKKQGMQTGFFTTQHILPLLADAGEAKLAYDLLLQEDCPGWMYQIRQGATTTWERWDALQPDGKVQEEKMGAGNMVSFNHYAFGSVGEFYYQYILGIKPLKPGYQEISIHPYPDRRLGKVSGSYHSVAGEISVAWEYRDDQVYFHIQTPVNTRITLPNGEVHETREGKYEYLSDINERDV